MSLSLPLSLLQEGPLDLDKISLVNKHTDLMVKLAHKVVRMPQEYIKRRTSFFCVDSNQGLERQSPNLSHFNPTRASQDYCTQGFNRNAFWLLNFHLLTSKGLATRVLVQVQTMYIVPDDTLDV